MASNRPDMAAYTNAEKDIELSYPSPTVVGYTTPHQFTRNIDVSMIEGGLIGRFLFFMAERRPQKQGVHERSGLPMPDDITDWVRDQWQAGSSGNISSLTDGDKKPSVLKRSINASEMLDKACDDWDLVSEDEGSSLVRASLAARFPEKAAKLAMIFCFSRMYRDNLEVPDEISTEDMGRAISLAEFLVERSIAWLETEGNEREELLEKVIAFIRSDGITKSESEIMRKFRRHHKSTKVFREDVLDSLKQMSTIIEEPVYTPTGQKKVGWRGATRNDG